MTGFVLDMHKLRSLLGVAEGIQIQWQLINEDPLMLDVMVLSPWFKSGSLRGITRQDLEYVPALDV